MNTKRWPIALALLLAGALSACAAAATPTQFTFAPTGMPATSAPAATAAPTTAAVTTAAGGQPGLLPAARQMIIKNADIELLVPDSKRALARVSQMAADDGGYIISTQTSFVGDREQATLQLAVPVSQFEALLNSLRGLGTKVLKEDATGQDVSAEYTDLQSRLNNLEATAARVRTFLDASKTVEDSLRVNSQLSELEGQIEQIKGQMHYYEGRAAFSTVSVILTPEPPVIVPEPEPAWDPLRTFNRASAALGRMLRTSADVAIWVAVLSSPLALALLGLLLVRLIFIRRPAAR